MERYTYNLAKLKYKICNIIYFEKYNKITVYNLNRMKLKFI